MKKSAKGLSKDEILGLERTIRQAFQALNKLKQEEPLAKYIQYPKIPSIFSESIAAKVLPHIFSGFEAIGGGITADILLVGEHGTKTVEVKATGKSGFQYFGEKDCKADYLLWISFGDYFQNDTGTIDVLIMPKINGLFKQRKITLKDFKKVCDKKLILIEGKKILEIIDNR